MAISTIGQLRELVPYRALTKTEAEQLAERQATRLLTLAGVTEPAVGEEIITSLPRIQVGHVSMPFSGSSNWISGRWVIELNQDEAFVRNRWTLAHELKHILDHPYIDRLYPDLANMSHAQRAERAADYFAACLLIPRRLVKKAWGNGLQDQQVLAEVFAVSSQAMGYRLRQLGLVDPTPRHRPYQRPVPTAA